jgi:hypothetical protein
VHGWVGGWVGAWVAVHSPWVGNWMSLRVKDRVGGPAAAVLASSLPVYARDHLWVGEWAVHGATNGLGVAVMEQGLEGLVRMCEVHEIEWCKSLNVEAIVGQNLSGIMQ